MQRIQYNAMHTCNNTVQYFTKIYKVYSKILHHIKFCLDKKLFQLPRVFSVMWKTLVLISKMFNLN